jgi:hypothetical protein
MIIGPPPKFHGTRDILAARTTRQLFSRYSMPRRQAAQSSCLRQATVRVPTASREV